VPERLQLKRRRHGKQQKSAWHRKQLRGKQRMGWQKRLGIQPQQNTMDNVNGGRTQPLQSKRNMEREDLPVLKRQAVRFLTIACAVPFVDRFVIKPSLD
jgi:hypothetical protein